MLLQVDLPVVVHEHEGDKPPYPVSAVIIRQGRDVGKAKGVMVQ